MAPGLLTTIQNSTDVAAVRRSALHMARKAGFDDEKTSDLGIVVTEAATNVLKHGGGGDVILQCHPGSLVVSALDKGPGIGNTAQCFEDGYSTAGTAGTGLGAVSRLSAFRDLYSVQGGGTVLVTHVGKALPDGVVSIPYPGETVCGDGWLVQRSGTSVRLFVIDGLGHGPAASEAAQSGVELAVSREALGPAELLQAAHLKLRSSRGAAASVIQLECSNRQLTFAGIGNVAGILADSAVTRRQMIGVNGTLGHEVRKVQPFSYAVEKGGLVILQSDGLSANWSFDKYPGLFRRHPSVIAAVIFRDFRRLRDDATILVARADGDGA